MNPSDFFLQSVLPLERMFREGVFDSSIKYVPVLDGLQQPRYFQWWLSPFTPHKVHRCTLQPCTMHAAHVDLFPHELPVPLPT